MATIVVLFHPLDMITSEKFDIFTMTDLIDFY